MNGKEGFTEFTIRRCSDCKFHTRKMIRSGREPIREHECQHPDVQVDMSKWALGFASKKKGRMIGRDDETPHWCPYIPKEKE